jgi:hypothetical protein
MNNETVTRGIFYCRDSAKMKGCGSLQTSLRLDSVVLRNRQQKHTAIRCMQGKRNILHRQTREPPLIGLKVLK